MLSYEKAAKSWASEAVLRSLQVGVEDKPNPNNGPAPMEVDWVEPGDCEGGKHGGKGKHKAGGKGWWNAGTYAFGRGRGGGGRGKGKSKGKNKGKSNRGSKKGKGKNKVDPQQCRLCPQYGHWSRECPNRMQVNQVAQQQPPNASYAPISSATSTVRRIFSVPMGLLALSSASGSTARVISSGEMPEHVVILDNGSDGSLLPLHYAQEGDQPVDGAVQLRDAQGEQLRVDGYKTVSLVVKDDQGEEAELEHCFLVGDVKSCVLSSGQLY